MSAGSFDCAFERGSETERRTMTTSLAGVGWDGLRLRPAELGEAATLFTALLDRVALMFSFRSTELSCRATSAPSLERR